MIDYLLKHDLLPDAAIRFGIRRLLKQRLQQEAGRSGEGRKDLISFLETMRQSPIAIRPEAANRQHYEVPAEFYQLVLGEHLKYSSAFFHNGEDLSTAENNMLRLTCERADLKNGQRVLELGCGWGSLTLFMAAQFPDSRIVAVSNSHSQKDYIDRTAASRGLSNVTVLTADMNDFTLDERFDRIVSVEMFEHMRNYERLLEKIHGMCDPNGRLFIHIFTHRKFTYPFEDQSPSDWMARYFFTGGLMPANDLLYHFDRHFTIEQHWLVNGTHYEKTANMWLRNMDAHQDQILKIFERTYGPDQAQQWWAYWRVFFMACAELWGFNEGREWLVSHYRLAPHRLGGKGHE